MGVISNTGKSGPVNPKSAFSTFSGESHRGEGQLLVLVNVLKCENETRRVQILSIKTSHFLTTVLGL